MIPPAWVRLLLFCWCQGLGSDLCQAFASVTASSASTTTIAEVDAKARNMTQATVDIGSAREVACILTLKRPNIGVEAVPGGLPGGAGAHLFLAASLRAHFACLSGL